MESVLASEKAFAHGSIHRLKSQFHELRQLFLSYYSRNQDGCHSQFCRFPSRVDKMVFTDRRYETTAQNSGAREACDTGTRVDGSLRNCCHPGLFVDHLTAFFFHNAMRRDGVFVAEQRRVCFCSQRLPAFGTSINCRNCRGL